MDDQLNELQKIKVVIAGRSYPLKVSKEEAKIIPIIEKEINDQLRQIQMSFAERDIQDCLTMVLLTKVLENQKIEPTSTKVLDKIQKLNQKIEAVI